ncbi:MAG: amidohydrolase family protein [Acidimicrobiales bacterium]|nr:amidohydrolase family protein [Acidimicrobiales bacterium]
MRIIDVHAHCLSGTASAAQVAASLTGLHDEGLEALLLIMAPVLDMSTKELADMYPPEAQDISQISLEFELPFGQEVMDHLQDPTFIRPLLALQTYLPLLMAGGDLDDCMARVDEELRVPLAGLKVHYFGTQIGPSLLSTMYGSAAAWDQDRFDEFMHGYVDLAAVRGLPVVVHVDLREAYDGFVDLVRSHPSVPVCLCHFGYSRRLCSMVLEELPDLVVDMSGIELHRSMWERLDAYRSFITEHAERVLFGSDQYIGAPDRLRRSWDLVDALELPEHVEERLRWRNASRFLQGREAASPAGPRSATTDGSPAGPSDPAPVERGRSPDENG